MKKVELLPTRDCDSKESPKNFDYVPLFSCLFGCVSMFVLRCVPVCRALALCSCLSCDVFLLVL